MESIAQCTCGEVAALHGWLGPGLPASQQSETRTGGVPDREERNMTRHKETMRKASRQERTNRALQSTLVHTGVRLFQRAVTQGYPRQTHYADWKILPSSINPLARNSLSALDTPSSLHTRDTTFRSVVSTSTSEASQRAPRPDTA